MQTSPTKLYLHITASENETEIFPTEVSPARPFLLTISKSLDNNQKSHRNQPWNIPTSFYLL